VKDVTVRNCYVSYVSFFDGFVKNHFIGSIVMGSSISHYGPVVVSAWLVFSKIDCGHIYNTELLVPLTVHILLLLLLLLLVVVVIKAAAQTSF